MGVTPVPTDQEAAVIAAAVELLWPVPVVEVRRETLNSDWRFSGRRRADGWAATTSWSAHGF